MEGKTRSSTRKGQSIPATPTRSPEEAAGMADWVKDQWGDSEERFKDKKNSGVSLHEKFAGLGTKMGLSGEALAKFITESVRNEEDKVRQQRKDEEEEARVRKRDDEEMKFRSEELQLKRKEAERLERVREEELRIKRDEAERLERVREEKLRIKKEESERLVQVRDEELRIRKEELVFKEREVEAKENQHVQLDSLGDGEDVDAYIAHFERVAALCKWKQSSWSTRLIALLRWKAREAVLRLHSGDLTDYTKVKSALLKHFRLDAEAYRRKFRSIKKDTAETFEQLLDRLRSCFSLWCLAAEKDENNVEDIKDLLLQEQMYQVLNAELLVEVRKCNPRSAKDIAREATNLAEAKRMGREARQERGEKEHKMPSQQSNPTSSAEYRADIVVQGPSLPNRLRGSPRPPSEQLRSTAVCFNCKQPGHVARQCPESSPVFALSPGYCLFEEPTTTPSLCVPCAQKPYTPRCKVWINGLPANGLRDMGAGYTVVADKLVPLEAYTGETITVVLAESRCRSKLPVANVFIESPFIQGEVQVLVMKSPVEEVLVGNFVLRKNSERPERVPVYADPTLTASMKTQAQTRGGSQPDHPISIKDQMLTTSRGDLIKFQAEDVSLRKAREACQKETVYLTKTGEVSYFLKQGVLMRRFESAKETVSQVCVPEEMRSAVMALGHEIPKFGHLGARQTREWVMANFYWPGVCADITQYCQSCVQCQQTVDKGKVPPAPLLKIPLMRKQCRLIQKGQWALEREGVRRKRRKRDWRKRHRRHRKRDRYISCFSGREYKDRFFSSETLRGAFNQRESCKVGSSGTTISVCGISYPGEREFGSGLPQSYLRCSFDSSGERRRPSGHGRVVSRLGLGCVRVRP